MTHGIGKTLLSINGLEGRLVETIDDPTYQITSLEPLPTISFFFPLYSVLAPRLATSGVT